jgi:lipopolysaccharide/colanic/teichoic acid biosynthesis glycosyltransferase
MKRSFDFIFALLALLILGVPMGLIALGVRWRLGSPVIFTQLRPGLHGQVFRMFKFRTMTNALDKNGHLLPDKDRLTPFGLLLRRTSLDELPELLNVLKGEMSLVGPRPLLVQYLESYTSEQARRHEVLPGITGWAQINGRNAASWDERFKMDVWYVDNQSLLLDIKILILTVKKVLAREGVTAQNAETPDAFTGSKK